MEYPQLKLGEDSKLWLAAASREIGRKQPDMPTGSNTMHFLDHRNLPAGRKAMYLRIVAAIKMQRSKRTASASPLAATASTTKAKSALLRPT
jgi:hypothetical protein